MSTFSTNAGAADFSRNMGDTVSDLVAGLQRINARRAAMPSTAIKAQAVAGAAGRRCEAAIPALAAGFGFAAWLG